MQEMWEREHQKIKKIIPKTNGIFSHMNYTFRDEISKSGLDLMFFSNYGLRSPSPIVETIQETPGSQLTSAELDVLAALILEMYKVKWDKLGEVYDIEYDPNIIILTSGKMKIMVLEIRVTLIALQELIVSVTL